MKRSLLILLAAVFLTISFSGCSASGSNRYAYDAPQIKSISSSRTGVSITVNAVEGVSSYRILRKNDEQKWAVYAHSKSPSFTDENVEGGGTYTYTVLCESEDGKTPLSGYDSQGKTIQYISVPELSAISNAYGGVKIEWKAPKGAVKYRVLRKDLEEEDEAEWKTVASTTSLNFTDTTVESGKKYSYTVRCITKNGTTASSFDSNGLTIQYYDAPVLGQIIGINGIIRISWRAVEGADQYRVYRKDEATNWSAIADTTDTKFLDDTTDEGKTYSYTVRSLDVYGRPISSFDPQGVTIMR